ncbi:translocase of chloroplast 120, chloroplastic-like [Andrographis paniculata]|uniref:translocase of chloroplast 120, chloroplastic-like n=1 Tax=Andrographis paniculata TaxID=175694 RepID=UPI0021E9975F|nr:translocase of chloroplast 120, chloroplastic-like [Andrographis paniculata]
MGNDIVVAEKLGARPAAQKVDLSLVGESEQSNEDEIFEEAIGIESPTIVSKNTTTSEGAGGENLDEKQNFRVELTKNEINRVVDDGSDENSIGDLRELVDLDANNREIDNLGGGQKILDNSDKNDDGIFNNSGDLEVLNSEDTRIVAAGGAKINPYNLETQRHELMAIQDVNTVNGAYTLSSNHDTSEHNINLVGSLNNGDGKGAEKDRLNEHAHEVPLEVEGADAGRGTRAKSRPESNGDPGHKNELEHQLDKPENISINILLSELKEDQIGEQVELPCISDDILKDDDDELKKLDSERVRISKVDSKDADQEASGDLSHPDNLLHSEMKEIQIGELVEKPCISGDTLKGDMNIDLKKLDSKCGEVESVKDADKDDCIVVPSADAYFAIDHAKESSEFTANSHDGRTLDQETEVDPCSSSSEILVESSRSSEIQLGNSNDELSATVVKRREQEGVRIDLKEIHLPETREQEVKPVSGISSSLDKYPEPTPAHPFSLDNASETFGSISQDEANSREQEITPTASISSATTSSPHRDGINHIVPLPEPVLINKEEGPKSPASVTSNNVPTASAATHPAGLGRAPLLESASRVVQVPRVNGAVPASQNQIVEDPTNGDAEEYDETREKLQMIRVKFLRLAHRLGQTPHNVVVAQVLYRLGLAEQLHGRSGGRVAAFSFDRASALAEQLEAAGQEPLDFTCTIMVLGKSGVGKSATINSIFDEVMFGTDAFQSGTKRVQDIVGTVHGIRVRVIDTPGLLPSWSDQRQNEKILHSVKKFIKKTPPDIILYLDRLDMQSRNFGDMPLLQTITGIFGPSVWFNAIVVLTHAASAPPEGPNGTTTSYDMFVSQRLQAVQQAIRQAAGDMRLMNPVSLVENHSACRTNRAGQRVLPNGQVWKPHLLLLSFASKILAEANTLLKLQDTPSGRPSAPRTRSLPLPFLLSSLLQPRPEVKLPSEQFGSDEDAYDDDLEECSDSEEESDYDELPPFKSLTKAQLEKLTKEQRKAYYNELEYREKLFMKKQLKEERKRRKMMKKLQEETKASTADFGSNDEEETSAAASVPVAMPDLVLPASFDSDNPAHRYRSLDSSNPWLVRAVLETNGWDHDIGYDGINVERLFVVKDKVPISFSGHLSKDKKDTNLQMEVASSVKHGNGKETYFGFDMQSVGKDYAYTLRSETRFSKRKINKASAGLSATVLGDVLTGGIKVEDKLTVGKQGQLVISGGAICSRGEVAYGGSLEATVRDKDHPFGRFLSTLGLSVMDWHGDLALGCNAQTQIPIGRHSNLIGRLNINNRGSGQLSLRINSSEQLQIVLVGLIPLVKKVLSCSEQVQQW